MLFGLTAQILGDFTSEGGVVSVDIVGDLAGMGWITQFGLAGDTLGVSAGKEGMMI